MRTLQTRFEEASLRYLDQYMAFQVRHGLFKVRRGLRHYEQTLGPRFSQLVQGLRRGERWLDLGTGAGRALGQYLKRGGHASVVGLDIRMPRIRGGPGIKKLRRRFGSRFTYKDGKRFQDYSPPELGGAGSFSLITDVGASGLYDSLRPHELRKTFNMAGRLLREGGHFCIFLVGRDQIEWIKSMSGFEPVHLQWRGFAYEVVLRRTKDSLHIPKHFFAIAQAPGKKPERIGRPGREQNGRHSHGSSRDRDFHMSER